MFSSLTPEEIPDAPEFDCLEEPRFRSNSDSKLVENNDSMSSSCSFRDVSAVRVEIWAVILVGSLLQVNFRDLGGIRDGVGAIQGRREVKKVEWRSKQWSLVDKSIGDNRKWSFSVIK